MDRIKNLFQHVIMLGWFATKAIASWFTVAITAVIIVLAVIGIFKAGMEYSGSEREYEGYAEGVKYANESCYALIDYSQGFAPSLTSARQ